MLECHILNAIEPHVAFHEITARIYAEPCFYTHLEPSLELTNTWPRSLGMHIEKYLTQCQTFDRVVEMIALCSVCVATTKVLTVVLNRIFSPSYGMEDGLFQEDWFQVFAVHLQRLDMLYPRLTKMRSFTPRDLYQANIQTIKFRKIDLLSPSLRANTFADEVST